jgi:hypothetical protein
MGKKSIQFNRYLLKIRIKRTSGILNASPITQTQNKTKQIQNKTNKQKINTAQTKQKNS